MAQNNIQRACDTYSIDYWSEGYFDINAQGQVDVGTRAMAARVALPEVLKQAEKLGLQQPLLIR